MARGALDCSEADIAVSVTESRDRSQTSEAIVYFQLNLNIGRSRIRFEVPLPKRSDSLRGELGSVCDEDSLTRGVT